MVSELRVGLIGAGAIAGVHIAGWHRLGAQVSVYSRSGAAHLVAAYGVTEAPTLEALLADCTVISILTPTPTHHGYALAAIAAGRHVVCEKPLADTTARAAEIVGAAAAAGVRLFPAHVVRYFPEYVAAKAALSAGQPDQVHLSRASAAPAAGSWFFDEARGGGIVRDQMIHDLDQARWLAGEVSEVFATQQPPSVNGRVPRPVTACVELRHESGAVSTLRGEWGPDELPFATSIELTGPDGRALYTWPGDGAAPAAAASPGDYLPSSAAGQSPYDHQIADFAQAFSSGEPARVAAFDGVMAVALAEAAAASLRSNQRVAVSTADVRDLVDRAAAAGSVS